MTDRVPLYLQVRSADGRKYEELPENPHPITLVELVKCRERFGEEVAKNPGLFGVGHAPQTTAREILAELVPSLSSFDRLALGFAVATTHVRVSPNPDGPFDRIP